MSFYADHLENFVSSNEISVPNKASFHTQLEWREKDLPQVFSATNSISLMMDKRLIILLWLTNEESDQEVIGQVNIKMRDAFSHLNLQQI